MIDQPYQWQMMSVNQAAKTIRDQGAVFRPDKSTTSFSVYWSGRLKTWISLERNPDGSVILKWWRGCLCSGQ